MASSFDVVVIGGGPGGYVAALRAAQLGAKTAIVEKDRMGGTCLVRGCIPTKALLQSSELYTLAKEGRPFGLVADNVGFDWQAAQKRKAGVVDQLVKGVEGLLKAGGVTSLTGAARLAGKGAVDVGGDTVRAKDIVIATGSAVAKIPLPGAELTIDSDQILELKEIPRRLAVIGGGVVGMEFAAMFAALGSKVTVLEMLPQVLAMVDADLVNVYTKHFAGQGGEIHVDSKVSEVVRQNGALQVRFSSGGEGGAVEADQVLLAVGRVPYTHGLDAEKAGVKLERNRVVVDEHLHTDADGIWAIGDVIGGIMLAHIASYEGVCAVENIAGHSRRVPDYHAAPNCVYTDPEIAHVGLGEKDAKDKGIAVKIGKFPFAASGRALTLGQTEGFVKVLADAESGRLLGAHIVGPRATDLIAEATLAIQNGLTLEQVDLTIHAHPTLPESVLEAALAAHGRAIHMTNRRAPAPQQTAAMHQNQEKSMAATVKPSSPSPPPAPESISSKSLELNKQNKDLLLGMHRQMQLIRRFEERAQEQYTKAKIGGYCHLNIGEEATVVGGIAPLRAGDYIYTSYREHGHAIARGVDPKAVMAELFGRETGSARGRGGSMHIFDYDHRFMGGYGIVGGHLPLATGAGFAIKYQKLQDVVFCMFGDGATNIGAFHESLNYAKVMKLPVVWFCINNKYGMGTAVERASAVADIYKRACAYDMESHQVDGNKVLDVLNLTHEIVERTRKDSEPRFIEAVCYRFKGHSVVDPDKYRSDEEKKKYTSMDPIHMFEVDLENAKLAAPEDFERVKAKAEREVEEIYEYADQAPNPKLDELYKYVYSDDWSERMPHPTPGGLFDA